MLALYRCDRQADALQAFQDARRALVDDLGIEPGERLRELERAILAQDPALALPRRCRAAPPRLAPARRVPAAPRPAARHGPASLCRHAALAERLDPEFSPDPRRSTVVRTTCAAVVESHGGTVVAVRR